ncbi:MAG TPA: BamA/TamA family outer membrane protein [Bryobacteraceae bacterium]|nr:BamA/TamA family outer membrane protein [Bryobacteraceae bacterium]
MPHRTSAFCRLLACAAPVLYLHAQPLESPSAYEGKPVQEVHFDPSSQPATESDLARLMIPVRAGAPLTLDDVRTAIQKLYSTGLYSNIDVEAQPAGAGLDVVIHTSEQWFIGPVEVKGKVSDPPTAGQLVTASRLMLGTPFSEDDIRAAVQDIQDLFHRNGLYLAGVVANVDRDPAHREVAVTFTVTSGKRARLTLPQVAGDTRLPPLTLARAARYRNIFRRWKSATQANVQSGLVDITRKYVSAHRLTAAVTMQNQQYLAPQNRVKVTVHADGGPKVNITARGAKISRGKLEKYVPIATNQSLNRDILIRGVRNLRDYFQNAGYFDVSVDFETSPSGPDQENVTYIIGLGQRQKLVRVAIEGNHYFDTKTIRERMFLQPAGYIRLRHGRFSTGFQDRDREAITSLYRDNGFQDVKVSFTPIPNYQGKKGDLAVTVLIEEGPQYKVGSLNLQGVEPSLRDRLAPMLQSIPGEPYSETSVAMDRDFLLTQYQSDGYPEAGFEWRHFPGKQPDTIDLVYVVTPGRRQFVRDVLITGLRTTRRRLIAPNITLKSGQPLSWVAMGDMQRRLYNLGVFENVNMAIQNPDGDTQDKYVLYHVNEGHLYYAAIGFGAELAQIGGSPSSLSAPGGQTGFAPNGSLQLSRLNMWGLGHSVNFKSNYSTLDRQVSLNYLIPRYRNVQGLDISFTGLYDNERDVRTFTARRVEADAQVGQRLSRTLRLLWRYSWRNVQVDQSTLKINPDLIPLESQPANIGMFSASLIQDRRDDPINTHRGIYNSLDMGLAETAFGGNKDFTRLLARNSIYHRLFGDWVFAMNTQFGWIHPFHVTSGETAFNYIPFPERFFGGGTNSMRGFPDNQAGPRDLLTGFPLGGNALFFNQDEVRFPLIGQNIGGVLFHDMGNIFTDLGAISFSVHQNSLQNFNYMVHAVGFGIRYQTPVGPVRVDLAYSINPPTFYGLQGTYQQLLFGGATPTIQNISHFQFFISIGQAF